MKPRDIVKSPIRVVFRLKCGLYVYPFSTIALLTYIGVETGGCPRHHAAEPVRQEASVIRPVAGVTHVDADEDDHENDS